MIEHDVKTVYIGESPFVRLEDYEKLLAKYESLKKEKNKKYEKEMLEDGERR